MAQISPDDLPDAAEALSPMSPQAVPALKFTTASGEKRSLADYAGHGLVVNIWATWCGPCVAELPSLAAIAPKLSTARILVLPISIDLQGADVVRPFYASHGITTLPILLDPDGSATQTLNADGIPLTIILDPQGRMVARLEGGANWDTTASLAAIHRLAGQAPPDSGFQPV